MCVSVCCSDGMGRSGTYCLIDMVLNRLSKGEGNPCCLYVLRIYNSFCCASGAKEIDIAATLEHIRDQRASMVRTREQFEFALACVAEEVHSVLRTLPAPANGT